VSKAAKTNGVAERNTIQPSATKDKSAIIPTQKASKSIGTVKELIRTLTQKRLSPRIIAKL
jgi:hypothetical protein